MDERNARIVAFDESGNTGQNLLDPAQPVFVLASVHLTVAQMQEMRRLLGWSEGDELHFVRLKRSRRGRRRIVDVMNLPWIQDEVVKAVVYHKRFMIVTKIVDMLIEEHLHRVGIDLYKHGRNIALANLLYHVTPVLCDDTLFDEMLRTFVRLAREPTTKTIDEFYAVVRALQQSCKHPPFREELDLLLVTQGLASSVFSAPDATAVDPAVPAFLHAATEWNEQFRSDFRIVHDESKPVAYMQEILEYFMAEDEPEFVSGYDRRKARFPIRADGINFVDSATFPVVQAADFFAGAIGYYFRGLIAPGARDELWEALHRSRCSELNHGVIWPSLAITPEELGTDAGDGTNPIDSVVELIRRQAQARDDLGDVDGR